MPIGTYPALPITTNPFAAANAIEQQGANPNNASEITVLQSILTNGAPAAANNSNFQTSAAATITLTNIGGLIQRLTNGGAVTVTMDNAWNIGLTIPGLYAGMAFPMQIITNAATTVAAPTVTNTGVTLSGTTTVLAAACRWYQVLCTQLYTIVGYLAVSATWTSLAQVGTSNLYTVTLGANSGATPTVGTAIHLAGITGTLPAGYYPVYSAASATSFVIAAPPASTAWTATAVTTIGDVSVVPATYAPLFTMTGVMATVTATMSV